MFQRHSSLYNFINRTDVHVHISMVRIHVYGVAHKLATLACKFKHHSLKAKTRN